MVNEENEFQRRQVLFPQTEIPKTHTVDQTIIKEKLTEI